MKPILILVWKNVTFFYRFEWTSKSFVAEFINCLRNREINHRVTAHEQKNVVSFYEKKMFWILHQMKDEQNGCKRQWMKKIHVYVFSCDMLGHQIFVFRFSSWSVKMRRITQYLKLVTTIERKRTRYGVTATFLHSKTFWNEWNNECLRIH